ncbi:threonine ammonia-lyase [Metallumcola ferriviriculae]|uniref:L-threonine dehydratase catabolic TdcB n=1 Tax=Metallumcola ferriviriculae TaxID=3039180 RepID=A0AAU0UJN9_9FIRM|nr:threonine ammonia-lyase [Desulfitibacteraceae bacterium MK1]
MIRNHLPVSVGAIKDAAELLYPVIHMTAMDHSATFSELTGLDVYLKQENFQKTGSFKIRGAYNKIHNLSIKERQKGVIAASAGNHAQGVAYAAALLNTKATIIMPEGAPITKATATKGYGAEVILAGENYDAAYEKAIEIQKETGATFVHAFNDAHIIAGQGTIGIEMLDQQPDLDAILVPVGGGGLISGIATAAKAKKTGVKVIGVEAAGAPSMKASLKEGKVNVIEGFNTIADGIAVKTPGDITFKIVKELVDDVVVVDDEEIATAVLMLLERSKMVAEASGAVTLAALLAGKVSLPGIQKAACVISGGNIDVNIISQIINRGLVKTGRLARFRTIIPDRPGSLQQLLSIIARAKANIITVNHDRLKTTVPITETMVELTMETRDSQHVQNIADILDQSGYPTETI